MRLFVGDIHIDSNHQTTLTAIFVIYFKEVEYFDKHILITNIYLRHGIFSSIKPYIRKWNLMCKPFLQLQYEPIKPLGQ